MAQLRDRKTSEVVFEGTPIECAALADEIGFGEVLFDDVGVNFDPKAALKVRDDEIRGTNAVTKSSKIDPEDRERAAERVKALRAEIDGAKKQKTKVAAAIERARDRSAKAAR